MKKYKEQKLVKFIRRSNGGVAYVEYDYKLQEGEEYTQCACMWDIDRPLSEWERLADGSLKQIKGRK